MPSMSMETLLDPGRRIVQKGLLGSGSSSAVTLLTDRTLWISLCSTALTTLIAFLRHPDHRDSSILFLGNPRGLKMRLIFRERIEAPLPPLRPNATSFIHDHSVPFPNAWNCHLPMMKSLCGYEDIVSSGTDQFTAWVKVSPHEVLVQHMVDIQKATADFREASERKPATSSHTNSVNKHFATRSIVQKRLSIYNWNPGPRRGKEDAFEKQIAGGGISLPCRRRPNMLIMTFLQVDSTGHADSSLEAQCQYPAVGHETGYDEDVTVITHQVGSSFEAEHEARCDGDVPPKGTDGLWKLRTPTRPLQVKARRPTLNLGRRRRTERTASPTRHTRQNWTSSLNPWWSWQETGDAGCLCARSRRRPPCGWGDWRNSSKFGSVWESSAGMTRDAMWHSARRLRMLSKTSIDARQI